MIRLYAAEKLLFLVAVTLLSMMVWLPCSRTQAAEFTAKSDTCKLGPCKGETVSQIYLIGPIVPGDFERFRAKIRELGPSVISLGLMSPGGDINEAMRIGRLVRSALLRTVAPSVYVIPGIQADVGCPDGQGGVSHSLAEDNGRCVCFSACFLIYAAGVYRAGSYLAMHRPYFDPSYFAGLSSADADAKYDRMIADVRSYMTEMQVPEPYFARMIRVASDQAEFLSRDEVGRDLSGYLPSYDEWLRARCGRLTQLEQEALFQEYRDRAVSRREQELQAKQSMIAGCEIHELAVEREKVFRNLF